MRPRILHQNLEFDFPRTLVDPNQPFPEPGGVLYPLVTDPRKWGFPLLIRIAHANQYKPLPCSFSRSHFLRIGGSVNCHDDPPEFGLTIACLLHDEGSFHANTELVTEYGPLVLCEGDVFIFDSCEWHAWIAHGPCVLAAISVEEIG